MSSEELFRKVKDLNLPSGQYALFGSTPLGVRGIRESRDADVIAAGSLYQKLKDTRKWKTKLTPRGTECLINEDGDIEILRDWGPGQWDIGKLISNSEIIDGLPFVLLEEVLRWKKLYGREKDLNDVELIMGYIKNNGK